MFSLWSIFCRLYFCFTIFIYYKTMTKGNRGKGRSPSGLTIIWKFWRHSCCRFGWMPLLVAPLVTASCLMDVYSSIDCNFMQVNVGFIPSNAAWNQSTATLGLFQFKADAEPDLFNDLTGQGCTPFSTQFKSQFIDGDKTWEVIRIMAYISGISGSIATVRTGFKSHPQLILWRFALT